MGSLFKGKRPQESGYGVGLGRAGTPGSRTAKAAAGAWPPPAGPAPQRAPAHRLWKNPNKLVKPQGLRTTPRLLGPTDLSLGGSFQQLVIVCPRGPKRKRSYVENRGRRGFPQALLECSVICGAFRKAEGQVPVSLLV